MTLRPTAMLEPAPPPSTVETRDDAPFDAAAHLRRAAEGDGEAWQALVSAYTGRVFGLLYRQCRDRDLAEELTQATFVRLVEAIRPGGGYREQGRFEPWLFRVATNLLRDEARRRKRQARTMDMSPGAASGRAEGEAAWAAAQGSVVAGGPARTEDPGEQVGRDEEIARLRESVARLPEADQEVLHLRHTSGLSFAEIAEALGQPLGTVLARAHRAVGKLRKMLDDKEVPR